MEEKEKKKEPLASTPNFVTVEMIVVLEEVALKVEQGATIRLTSPLFFGEKGS